MRRLKLIAMVAVSVGCDAPAMVTPDVSDTLLPVEVQRALVPQVAEKVSAGGVIDIPFTDHGSDRITPGEAVVQATAYLATFAATMGSTLADVHGAPFRPGDLRAHSRVFEAVTPHETDNVTNFIPFKKGIGSYYLVTFTLDNIPAVSVAVSVYNTDVSIEGGRLVLPLTRGNDFVTVGIPRDRPFLSPEQAVVALSNMTGRRVADVPVLYRDKVNSLAPNYGVWRLVLEAPVVLERYDTGQPIETQSVFVGHDRKLYVTSATQSDMRVITRTALDGATHVLEVRPSDVGFGRLVPATFR